MNSQLEFDCVKDLPKVPRMGVVRFELEYAVDLNDQSMVDHAKECLYEDIMSMVKYDEVFNGIQIVETTNVTYDDIPEFLTESID